MRSSRRAPRTCPACGAARQSATARWCGRCGAALAAPAEEAAAPRPRPRWLWPVAIVGIVALLAAATVVVARERPWVTRPPEDTGVALPPQGEVPEGDTAALACAPGPCALWRVADLPSGSAVAGGVAVVGSGVVAHSGHETLSVVEIDTGQVRWSQALPRMERRDAGRPVAMHVDDDLVVVGYASIDPDPTVLVGFDLETGERRFEARLDEVDAVHSIDALGEDLLVYATLASDAAGPNVVPVRVSPSGDEVERLPQRVLLLGDAMIRQSDDRVQAHRVADGELLWERDASLLDVDREAERVLLRGPDGALDVVEVADGDMAGSFALGPDTDAQFVGRWVGLRAEGQLRLMDVTTQEAIFVRDLPDRSVERQVPHLVLDAHTVVGWPVESGTEVAIHDDAGDIVGSWVHDGGDAQEQWVGLSPVRGRPELVQVVTAFGATVRWLRAEDAGVVRELADPREARGGPINFRDGLSWWLHADGLHLHGPVGSVVAQGVEHVVSVDPLIVHGPAGMLRLDPQALLGAATAGSADAGAAASTR